MYRISFAGAGNVASSLSKAFFEAGNRILQVSSRRRPEGEKVAERVNAAWCDRLRFDDSPDMIIVSVPDNALAEVLEAIECNPNTLLLHTAGSYGLEAFPQRVGRKGVLYPLQTFTAGRKIDFRNLPFLIEASDDEVMKDLFSLAGSLSQRIYPSGIDQRRKIHVAAVFACNFINHMLALSEKMTQETSFRFEMLHPLIKETISKALESGPAVSQTGPAARNDFNTINKHLELLSFSPGLKSLYEEITDSIIDFYKQNG